eukprot:1929313-Prymnesium_polylepis.1
MAQPASSKHCGRHARGCGTRGASRTRCGEARQQPCGKAQQQARQQPCSKAQQQARQQPCGKAQQQALGRSASKSDVAKHSKKRCDNAAASAL